MNAIPPSRKYSSHTSTADTTQRARPVSEIAFGVSRDSISRLRISAWYSARVGRGGRSTGGVVIAPRLWQRRRRLVRGAAFQAHTSGRARAKTPCAHAAATAATTAPRKPSSHQWLAVTTTTKETTGAYAHHRTCAQRRRAMRAIVTPSMSANATCIEGIAAYGLKSTSADPESGCTPVNAATESEKPSSGRNRGGAVGSAM